MEQHLLIRYLLKILCHGRKHCPVLSLNQVNRVTKLFALSGWKIQGVDPVDWLLFQNRLAFSNAMIKLKQPQQSATSLEIHTRLRLRHHKVAFLTTSRKNPQRQYRLSDYQIISNHQIPKSTDPIGAESQCKCIHRCSKSLWKKVFGSLSFPTLDEDWKILRFCSCSAYPISSLRFLCHVSWLWCNKSARIRWISCFWSFTCALEFFAKIIWVSIIL